MSNRNNKTLLIIMDKKLPLITSNITFIRHEQSKILIFKDELTLNCACILVVKLIITNFIMQYNDMSFQPELQYICPKNQLICNLGIK